MKEKKGKKQTSREKESERIRETEQDLRQQEELSTLELTDYDQKSNKLSLPSQIPTYSIQFLNKGK